MSAFLIIRVEDDLTAKLLAENIRHRFLALGEYVIGDIEDIQQAVDTLVENMDTITVLVGKELE